MNLQKIKANLRHHVLTADYNNKEGDTIHFKFIDIKEGTPTEVQLIGDNVYSGRQPASNSGSVAPSAFTVS